MAGSGIVTSDPVTEREPRRSVSLGPMVLASLVVLAAGWSALWLFARYEAARGFDAWVAVERDQGRIWTCANRQIGGYPLEILVRCDRPTVADAASNGAVRGTLASFEAGAKLYFPTSVTVTLTGPLVVEDKTAPRELEVSWSEAHLSLHGTMQGGLDHGHLQAENLVVTAQNGDRLVGIGHVEFGLHPLPNPSTGTTDADVTLKIAEATSAQVDTALGSAEPFQGSIAALVTRLRGEGATLAQLLEPWRQEGGHVQVQAFSFAKGGFTAKGDGHVGLDDDHRIAGALNARFAGLAPLAARFGIPLGAVQIGGLLSNLLGGQAPQAEPEGTDLALQIAAKAGRLFVGPVKTGVTLPPLY